MPPAPSSAVTLYGPRRVPGASATGSGWNYRGWGDRADYSSNTPQGRRTQGRRLLATGRLIATFGESTVGPRKGLTSQKRRLSPLADFAGHLCLFPNVLVIAMRNHRRGCCACTATQTPNGSTNTIEFLLASNIT